MLALQLQQHQADISQELLQRYGHENDEFLNNIFRGDDSLVHHFVPGNKTVNGVQSHWFDITKKFMIAASERYRETLGKGTTLMNSSSHETACLLPWYC